MNILEHNIFGEGCADTKMKKRVFLFYYDLPLVPNILGTVLELHEENTNPRVLSESSLNGMFFAFLSAEGYT